MKKGLIGIAILALIMLLSGTAFAVTFESIDVSVDATLEWTIFDETGLMPSATKEGPTLELPDLTISVGAWEASTDGDYIKYTAQMGTVSFKNAVDYNIYDLENGIAEAQGIALGTELASVSLDLVYTADEEYGVGLGYTVKTAIVATEPTTVEVEVVDEETWAWVDDDENVETPPIWGHPMKTVEEEVEEEVTKEETVVGFGVKYNSTGAYGVEVVYPIAPITLTGQYAIGSAYLAKVAYALTGERAYTGDSAITLQYKVIDAAEIKAELVDFPITATIMLQLGVTSAENSTGYNGEVVTTLVEGVTLTLAAESAVGEDFTYSGKIGVSF